MSIKAYRHLIIAFLCYSAISFFCIRNLISLDGTIGHNWDFPFSPLLISYELWLKKLIYVWDDASLGFANLSSLSSKIWWGGNALVAIILKAKLITQVKIMSSMTFLGFSMYYYLHMILGKSGGYNHKLAAFCAGLFFMMSPVVLGHLIGGAINQLDAMIFILFLLICLEYGRKGLHLYFAISIISITFLLLEISLQHIVFGLIFTFSYFFFIYEKTIKEKIVYLISFLVCITVLYVHWVIPMLYGLTFENVSQRLTENISFSNLAVNVPNITDALFVNGYVREFYNHIVLDEVSFFWYFCVYLFITILFISLFLTRWRHKFQKKIFLYWVSIYLFFLIFATGFKPPLGSFVEYIYRNFPLFTLFRSPQWFMNPLTIAFCVLLGLASEKLFSKYQSNPIKIICLCFIFITLHPTFFAGDLGIQTLYKRAQQSSNWYKADHLDLYHVPEDYRKSIALISKNHNDFRVLLLPLSLTPYYIATEYQREGAGIDPILAYKPPKSFLFIDLFTEYRGKSMLTILEKLIYKDNSLDFLNYLRLFNVDYILLKKDYKPLTTKYWDNWDIIQITSLLKKNIDSIGSMVIDGESTMLIKIQDKFKVGHIFIPNCLIFSDVNFEDSTDLRTAIINLSATAENQLHNIYGENNKCTLLPTSAFSSHNLDMKIDKNGEERIQYIKKNPSEYSVSIKNIKENFPLVFSESFHKGWKILLNPNKNNTFLSKLLFQNFLPENDHNFANGYANYWYIDLEYIKSHYPWAIRSKQDGTYEMEFTIYFMPQTIANICILISLSSLILIVGFNLYYFIFCKNGIYRDCLD